MAEYFLMEMLHVYTSSSSVRPISDIFSNGCCSTFLNQLYCQFSIISLDFVSGKKETVQSQLYLNYLVSVAILEVYILQKIRQFQIGLKTIKFWKLKKRSCFLSICSQDRVSEMIYLEK